MRKQIGALIGLVAVLCAGCGTSAQDADPNVRGNTPAAAATPAPQPAEAPAPTPAPASPRRRFSYSGNGGRTLPTFSLSVDETLDWTNSGGIFQIFGDTAPTPVLANSQAHKGSTTLAAGQYAHLQVNAIGSWSIAIH